MSGICGIYNFRRQAPVLSAEIKQMTSTMRHRGTGKAGLYLYQNVGLGVRQAATDCNFNCQPLASMDETIWVMFDGEIENYHELRKLPQMKKYHFYSDSDVELLLYLYQEFKESCAEHLRGGFTFVVWNKNEKRLMLARDALGMRNLFYAEIGGRLVFASEMKALLKDPRVPRSLDVRAINQFLHTGFVLAPDTIMTHVKKIAAGHIVSVSRTGCRIQRYREYQPEPKENAGIDQLKSELLYELEIAVENVVAAGQPLGILLGDGLDSALLVALARKYQSEALLTFNLRMSSVKNDSPTQPAQLIHQRYQTRHFELLFSPEDFLHHFTRAVWYQDEPIADPALVAQFQLYQFVKLNLDTVLSAEGADELWGGRESYLKSTLIPHAYYFTGSERNINWNNICRRLPRIRHWQKHGETKNGCFPIADCIDFDDQKIYSSQFWLKLKSLEEMMPVNGRTVPNGRLDRLLYFEVNDVLPDRVLPKHERFGAAISLNTKLPFLNQALVDLSARIPANFKINQTRTKYILRLLAREILPESIVWQRRRGRHVPMSHWLPGALKTWPAEILLNKKHFERGLFNPEQLRELVAAQTAGEVNASRFIYTLIILESWIRLFLDDAETISAETVFESSGDKFQG